MRHAPLNSGLSVVMLMLCQAAGHAQLYRPLAPQTAGPSNSLTIVWQPSPSPDVAGYVLYWGSSSNQCTNRLVLRNVTNATLAGFKLGETYHLAVAAYDAAGEESPWSNMIQHRRRPKLAATVALPELRLQPMTLQRTSSVLRLGFTAQTGGNYQLQATDDFRRWETLLTTNCSPGQQIQFELPFSAGVPQRFFRLRQQ